MSYENDGKKLFFHMSEVVGGIELQAGDVVEFVIIQNHRTGKASACNVKKIRQVYSVNCTLFFYGCRKN